MSQPNNASETLALLFLDLMSKAKTDKPDNLTEYASSYFRQLLDRQNFEGSKRKHYNGNSQLSKLSSCFVLQEKEQSTRNLPVDYHTELSPNAATPFFLKEVIYQRGSRKGPQLDTYPRSSALATNHEILNNSQQQKCVYVSRVLDNELTGEENVCDTRNPCFLSFEDRNTTNCVVKDEPEDIQVKSEPYNRDDYITPDEHHQYEVSSPTPVVHDAIELLPFLSSTSRDQTDISRLYPFTEVCPQLQSHPRDQLVTKKEKEPNSNIQVNIQLQANSKPGYSYSNDTGVFISIENALSNQPDEERHHRSGLSIRREESEANPTLEIEEEKHCIGIAGTEESTSESRASGMRKWEAQILENQNVDQIEASSTSFCEETVTDFRHKKLNYQGKRRKKFFVLPDDATDTPATSVDVGKTKKSSLTCEEENLNKSSKVLFQALTAKYKSSEGKQCESVSENGTLGSNVLKCKNNLELPRKRYFKVKESLENGISVCPTKQKTTSDSVLTKNLAYAAAQAVVLSEQEDGNSNEGVNTTESEVAVTAQSQTCSDSSKEITVSSDVGNTGKEIKRDPGDTGRGVKLIPARPRGRKRIRDAKETERERKPSVDEAESEFQVRERKKKSKRKRIVVEYHDDESSEDEYNEDAPYDCTECGKALKTEEKLIKHQRAHASNTPMKCKTCGKGFKMYGNLWKHERTHTGIKPHKCNICGKAFIVPSKLSRHMRVHTGERPYRCKVCNKSFMQGNDLVRHKLIHSGQKPFVCSACGKRFALCGNLKQHEVTHTGDRRHKCGMCDKMFGTSVERRKHERTHSKTKDFKCSGCNKAFKSPEYLRKHMKKMHGLI